MSNPTQQAILAAVQSFVKRHGGPSRYEAEVERIEGLGARVRVRAQGITPALVYLKRRGQSWEALALGTAFKPEFFRKHGLPSTLGLPGKSLAPSAGGDSFQRSGTGPM
ncbi:MAG TPA: hypothetical protein V6D47_06340 [Oscillatoriaceae cyanobacterium]